MTFVFSLSTILDDANYFVPFTFLETSAFQFLTLCTGGLLRFCLPGSYERGSSVVECRTRNQVSPGSNPPLLPFRRLGIFSLSIDALVDSAVYMSTWL